AYMGTSGTLSSRTGASFWPAGSGRIRRENLRPRSTLWTVEGSVAGSRPLPVQPAARSVWRRSRERPTPLLTPASDRRLCSLLRATAFSPVASVVRRYLAAGFAVRNLAARLVRGRLA